MSHRLFLILDWDWYELIENGVKTEEYRRVCPHWEKLIYENQPSEVLFQLGYKKIRRMRFKINAIYAYYPSGEENLQIFRQQLNIKAMPAWGFNPEVSQYIIKLGERISQVEATK